MLDSLDIQEMKRIAQDSYGAAIDRAFREAGGEALRDLLEFLIELYARFDPEVITGTLYVVRRINSAPATAVDSCVRDAAPPQTHRRVDRLPQVITGKTVIDVDGAVCRVWEKAEFDERTASASAIVYRYAARSELFIIKDSIYPVRNPAPIHASVYSRPTFSSLREALLDYRDRMVKTSFCNILRAAWEQEARLFLKPKPEWTMRRSLHQFLMTTLRDAEVRPEQIVDETHPVDIKVTWTLTTRTAIIEIKWLGKSRKNGRITVSHTENRARHGAKQLADYLAANRQAAPHRGTRGYLVVIDARRRRLRQTTKSLPREDAMHYEHREISYDPEYHIERDDFDPPIRMFAEPA